MLQRIFAAALGVLGLAAIGLAVGSVTLWRPADQVVAVTPETSVESSLVVVEPGVLDLLSDQVTVRAEASDAESVVIAVGRDVDVEGWVGPDAHRVIGGLADWETFAVDEVAGQPADPGTDAAEDPGAVDPDATEDPATADPAVEDPAAEDATEGEPAEGEQAGAETAEGAAADDAADPAAAADADPAGADPAAADPAAQTEGPDPAGSDLWIVQATGAGEATLAWTDRPGRWSVLVAAVGPGAGAPTVTFTWPQTVTTPWFGPGLLAGVALLVAALALVAREVLPWFMARRRAAAAGTTLPVGTVPAPDRVFEPVSVGTLATGREDDGASAVPGSAGGTGATSTAGRIGAGVAGTAAAGTAAAPVGSATAGSEGATSAPGTATAPMTRRQLRALEAARAGRGPVPGAPATTPAGATTADEPATTGPVPAATDTPARASTAASTSTPASAGTAASTDTPAGAGAPASADAAATAAEAPGAGTTEPATSTGGMSRRQMRDRLGWRPADSGTGPAERGQRSGRPFGNLWAAAAEPGAEGAVTGGASAAGGADPARAAAPARPASEPAQQGSKGPAREDRPETVPGSSPRAAGSGATPGKVGTQPAPAGSTSAESVRPGSTRDGAGPAGSTPAQPVRAGSPPDGAGPAGSTPAGSTPAGSTPAQPSWVVAATETDALARHRPSVVDPTTSSWRRTWGMPSTPEPVTDASSPAPSTDASATEGSADGTSPTEDPAAGPDPAVRRPSLWRPRRNPGEDR